MWSIPLNVALLIVPAMFGAWAWLEVIERIREEDAAVGRRTHALRLGIVATSASYLVGAGTWMHPATLEFVLSSPLRHRLGLYALILVPWIAFGIIGLLAHAGRRTGVRGFMQERTTQAERMVDTGERTRAILHAIGTELDVTLREMQGAGAGLPSDADHTRGWTDGDEAPADRLHRLAVALQVALPAEPTDVALDECLADRLERVRALAEDRGTAVFRTGLEGVHVRAGPQRLRQVLHVLLEGALERAPRGEGLVVITVRRKPQTDQVQLTISDNGKALTDADLAHAFALETEARPDRRPIPGLGFPLAMARRLARQDGGDLHIAPATSGGTVLALLIPSSDGAAAQEGQTHDH